MFRIDELKKKLENGGLAIGTHVKWREASFSELFAMEGYDYIWIDGEHSALTLDMVAAQVRAAQANGAAAFYRVPWNDPVLVKPVLEIGVDGVIFPFIRTAKEAAAAVAACKYPPEGIRGYAPGRAIRYGLTPMEEYFEQAKKTWVIAQLEHIDAVRNLDEILSVPGIDAFVVGMMDLSASIGKIGQLRDPQLLGLLDEIGEKCRADGRPFGVSMGYMPEIVEEWMARGARLISVGGDEEFLVKQGTATLQGMKGLFQKEAAR